MSENHKINLEAVISKFAFEGTYIVAVPYGFGHINDTYAVSFIKSDGNKIRYILQRINQNVFKSPEKVMENIQGVTDYLRAKITEDGGNPYRETLNLIPAVNGKNFYRNDDGSYWRAYIFIEEAATYQIVENLSHFYNAGKAFGKFQKLLGGYPARVLYETIPDFHNTGKRYEQFIEAVRQDRANRAEGARAEIDFVKKRASETSVIIDMLERGELPLRVTHNDTKFNNVMIDDKSGEGICVIDLDTVMPGSSLYDFGDSIRSGANPADEDEKDLSKVWMDLELFEQFAKGFLEAAGDMLTSAEVEYLPFGAKLMTFECGMRFLADHLNGDIYFKIHREGQNLDRARTQFKMVADMEEKFEHMKSIVQKYSRVK